MISSHQLRGTAGEYIAMADALANNIICQKFDGCPYDVLLDVNDRFIRVQVKTDSTNERAKDSVGFRVLKGATGKKSYKFGEVHLFAFVWMKKKMVAWMPFEETWTTRATIQKELFQDFTLERALSMYFSDSKV